ncbi:hypothetical protein VE00_02401 [Pseudogymnoascus sp. WSF 3629]|nr:hypothetical protein VE00_02401 [Pseudogymnoascus sp. WSF 3629]
MTSEKQHYDLTSSITPHAIHDEKSELTLDHDEGPQLPFLVSRLLRAIAYVVDSLPYPLAVLLVVALFVLAVFMTIKNVRKSWELWEVLREVREVWEKGCQPVALCNSWAGEGRIIGGK